MKIQAKRASATLPRTMAEGELSKRTFDGYNFVVHLIDRDGRDVRVALERHEAEKIAWFISAELTKQRAALAELTRIADQVLG